MIGINVDTSDLDGMVEGLESAIKNEMQNAGSEFTAAVYAKIGEIASQKLNTRLELYLSSLKTFQDGDVHVISLDSKARWIEEGMTAHNMIDDLLAGKSHRVIPLKIDSTGSPNKTNAQADLISTIKSEVKKFGVPYSGIENGNDGRPKTGLLHTFDITRKPIKTAEGPGQGKGPIGAVKQGNTGIPILQGLHVYQNEMTNKEGQKSVQRTFMTFRTVSESQRGSGKWDMPEIDAINAFDEAMAWAHSEFDKTYGPKLMDAIIKAL